MLLFVLNLYVILNTYKILVYDKKRLINITKPVFNIFLKNKLNTE